MLCRKKKQSTNISKSPEFVFIKGNKTAEIEYEITNYDKITNKFSEGIKDENILFYDVATNNMRPSFYLLSDAANKLLKEYIKDKYTRGLKGNDFESSNCKVKWNDYISLSEMFEIVCIPGNDMQPKHSKNIYADLNFNIKKGTEVYGDRYELRPLYSLTGIKKSNLENIIQKASLTIKDEANKYSIYLQPSEMLYLMKRIQIVRGMFDSKDWRVCYMMNKMFAAGIKSTKKADFETTILDENDIKDKVYYEKLSNVLSLFTDYKILDKDKDGMYSWHSKIPGNEYESVLNRIRKEAKTKHLFTFLCSACDKEHVKILLPIEKKGEKYLTYKNNSDMHDTLCHFFENMNASQFKNWEDEFRKDMTVFPKIKQKENTAI